MEEGGRKGGRSSLLILVHTCPFEHPNWPRPAADFAAVVAVAADLPGFPIAAAVAFAGVDCNAVVDCTAKA